MNARSVVGAVGGLWIATAGFAQPNPVATLELHVKSVVVVQATQSPVVILVTKDEKRFLPIWVGWNEAQAIGFEMHQLKPPRPLTHDLFASLVKSLDAKIEKVVITETKSNTYFAMLYVASHNKTQNIDCRPSDGIAIALRTKAPILAAESVMANALPLPEDFADESDAFRITALNLTVQALTADLVEAFQLGKAKGVLVSESHREQIHAGDLILAVGDSAVQSVEQLKAALDEAEAKKQKEFALKLLRNGKTLIVRVPRTVLDDYREELRH